jgi:hypothetical protein
MFSTQSRLIKGLSYWQVTLTSGKTFHEGQFVFDFIHGSRNISWTNDIVSSGDSRNISELVLCTPEGNVNLPILEPYTAFQLQRGTASLLTGERIVNCQIIGRVDDKDTGACTAIIWDAIGEDIEDGTKKHLYIDHFTTIKNFKKWRSNVADIGAISLDVVGVRLT